VPKSFQREAFDQWLSKNQEFFQHPPVIVKNGKNYFTMLFQGINSAIGCIITDHDYSISVDYKRECWDFLESNFVSERQTPSGMYFCGECKPKTRKIFPTRIALWEDHIFQRILNWATDNLLKTKWLCLFQYEGATWAKIVDEKNLLKEMQDKNFVKAISLMKNQVMPKQKSDTRKNKSLIKGKRK
jgi:hypothetical protein